MRKVIYSSCWKIYFIRYLRIYFFFFVYITSDFNFFPQPFFGIDISTLFRLFLFLLPKFSFICHVKIIVTIKAELLLISPLSTFFSYFKRSKFLFKYSKCLSFTVIIILNFCYFRCTLFIK